MPLFLSVFSGCLRGPEVSEDVRGSVADRLRNAADRWDFSGFHDSVDLQVEGLAWIHIVVPLTRTLAEGDIEFDVEWEYGDPERLPTVGISYYGRSMDGLWGGDGVVGATAYGESDPRALRFHAEVLGQPYETSQDVEHPPLKGDPRADRSPTYVRRLTGIDWPAEFERATEAGTSRPVYNVFLMVGGSEPVRPVHVWGNWKNTILNFTYGSSEDVFVHPLDDFRSTVRAGAAFDLVQASVGLDLRLGRNLAEGGTSAAFVFNGPTNLGGTTLPPEIGQSSYGRPDGSTQSLVNGENIEFTSMEGLWTFSVPDQTLLLNADLPALWGAQFEKARPPSWEQRRA